MLDKKTVEGMSVGQFLDYLTDINYHSERCLIEAIISDRRSLVEQACRVLSKHYEDGYLTDENGAERDKIYKEMIDSDEDTWVRVE